MFHVLCTGYLYRVFGHSVKTVQVCNEMIEAAEFPLPQSAALPRSRQKVKLNDGQRVPQVTLHHQIRQDDVPQVHSIQHQYHLSCTLLISSGSFY